MKNVCLDLYIDIILIKNKVTNNYINRIRLQRTMKTTVSAKHTLHSGIFHPVLRQWQSPNVEITTNNLMYPIFVS